MQRVRMYGGKDREHGVRMYRDKDGMKKEKMRCAGEGIALYSLISVLR